jgi:hypothetical protein
MKTKLLIISVLCLFLTYKSWSQDEKRKFLYLETGIDFISCEPPGKDYIRGDIDANPYDNPYYETDYVADQIRSLLHTSYAGLKFEYRILNNKLGISGGLRYTWYVSSIGKPAYWTDTPEYFFVQYGQDGTNTEYAKVKEITQRSGYLGVPVELRFYPFRQRSLNVYFKAGASFNYNITDKTNIVFYNDDMAPYEDEVSRIIEDPCTFYASLYLGVGLQIVRAAKPGINIEFNIPVGIETPGDPGFVDPQSGVGFQLMFRIPF